MSVVAARMRQVKLSPSVAIRAVLSRLREEKRRIVDLTIGEPDFATPEHIRRAACEAIERGETKYPLSQGTMALRRAVAERLRLDTGQTYEPEAIIVGTGAKQVLYNAFCASLEAGDEVIVPAPYWVSYPDMVELGGGTPVILPTDAATGFKIDPAALARAITPATKWLLLNAPSNPSGAVYDKIELAALAEVLRAAPHVHVMTDHIYARLTFADEAAPHILQVAPDLADRTLVVNGVSKAYAMTGWRIGYGAGPRDLVRAMAVIQSQSTSGASSIGQAAALAALTGPQDCVERFARDFKKRRDAALAILKDAPGLRCETPDGAFYIFPDCSALIGRELAGGQRFANDAEFVRYILEETGVAVIDGASYGVPSTFRLSFAASIEDVIEGCTVIRDLCLRLAGEASYSNKERVA